MNQQATKRDFWCACARVGRLTRRSIDRRGSTNAYKTMIEATEQKKAPSIWRLVLSKACARSVYFN